MIFIHQFFLVFFLIFFSCQTGKLNVIADLPSSLKETSAIEVNRSFDLFWVVEDAGNKNNLYGLNDQGKIIKDINIDNAENEDWEDLTSDAAGNIYIGDFGNNSKKRKKFSILKVILPETADDNVIAEKVNFTLPKNVESKDFEAFFIYKNYFYIFSKGRNKEVLIKVPNSIGDHVAEFVGIFNLPGKKRNQITSADISNDGSFIVLLNHDKVWKLSDFKEDKFFNGKIKSIEFKHKSQKEGVCFKNDSTLYITDESKKSSGGNLYSFDFE